MQAQGHPGMAFWMYKQAREEEEHAFRLIEFLTLKGEKYTWDPIREPANKKYLTFLISFYYIFILLILVIQPLLMPSRLHSHTRNTLLRTLI